MKILCSNNERERESRRMERLTTKKNPFNNHKRYFTCTIMSLIYDLDPVNECPLPTESNGQANWNSFL